MSYMEGRYVYGDDMYVDDYYMDEKWAYINDHPDYMVSNKGRVWSIKSDMFLKLKRLDNHGHLGVCLRTNGKPYYEYIHRLVAKAFIPNPHGHPIVRHLYDNPLYNTDEDLAWGTQRDNALDALANGTAYIPTDEDRYRGNKSRMTPLEAINVNTGERSCFESQGEASRALNIPQGNIWKVIHGQRVTAGGYVFKEVAND